MSINRLFDDRQLESLFTKVEQTLGPDVASKAFVSANAALAAMEQRMRGTGARTGTETLEAMRAALRLELETLLREH
jgi:hypothetical protein